MCAVRVGGYFIWPGATSSAMTAFFHAFRKVPHQPREGDQMKHETVCHGFASLCVQKVAKGQGVRSMTAIVPSSSSISSQLLSPSIFSRHVNAMQQTCIGISAASNRF